MAISDYDIVTSFDSAVDTEAGTALKEEKYFVPKIIGEGLKDTPDTPPVVNSGHYLTIQDSRFYKGTDPNIVFKGTVDSKTSHFKIIVNLPTDLYVSGVRIVRGFVIYETKLTNDNYMVIGGNKWTLTIPADDPVFNSVYSSMLSCPICYLTAITTDENDETYGDEAIFDWMVSFLQPTITSPNEYGRSIYIDTVDNLITLNVHTPSGIVGDIITITNNNTNEVQNITITKEMTNYNSINQNPDYDFTIVNPSVYGSMYSSDKKNKLLTDLTAASGIKVKYNSMGYGAMYTVKYLYTEGETVDFSAKITRNESGRTQLQSPESRRIFNIARFNHNSTANNIPLVKSLVVSEGFAPTQSADKLIPLYNSTSRSEVYGYLSSYQNTGTKNFLDDVASTVDISSFPEYIVYVEDGRRTYWCTKSARDQMVASGTTYLTSYIDDIFIRVHKFNPDTKIYETDFATFVYNDHISSNFRSKGSLQTFTAGSKTYIAYSAEMYDDVEYVYNFRVLVYRIDFPTKFIQLVDSLTVPTVDINGDLLANRNGYDSYYDPISINKNGDVSFLSHYRYKPADCKISIFKFDPSTEKYMTNTLRMPLVKKPVVYPPDQTNTYYTPGYTPRASKIIGNKLIVDFMLTNSTQDSYPYNTDHSALLAHCDAGRLTQEYTYINDSWELTNINEIKNNEELFNSYKFDAELINQNPSISAGESPSWYLKIKNVRSAYNAGGIRVPYKDIKYSPNGVWFAIVEGANHINNELYRNDSNSVGVRYNKYINVYKKNDLGSYEFYSRIDHNANAAYHKDFAYGEPTISLDINDKGEVYYIGKLSSSNTLSTKGEYYINENGNMSQYYTLEYESATYGVNEFMLRNNTPIILFKCKPNNKKYDVEFFTFSDNLTYRNYDWKNQQVGDTIYFNMCTESDSYGYNSFIDVVRYVVEDGIPFVYLSVKYEARIFSITRFVNIVNTETGEVTPKAEWYNGNTTTLLVTKVQVGNSAEPETVPVSLLSMPTYDYRPKPAIITSLSVNTPLYLRNNGTLNGYPNSNTIYNVKEAVLNQYGTFYITFDGICHSSDDRVPNDIINNWVGVKQLAIFGLCLFGLKEDGTILRSSDDAGLLNVTAIDELVNIKSIFSTSQYFIAIKNDGSVYVDGTSDVYSLMTNARLWTNISSVVCGTNFIAGLKTDGTVVVSGAEPTQSGTPYDQWVDIKQIAANNNLLMGLKANGTIVYSGTVPSFSITPALAWKNLSWIACNNVCWYGVQTNGKVLGIGSSSYYSIYWNLKI